MTFLDFLYFHDFLNFHWFSHFSSSQTFKPEDRSMMKQIFRPRQWQKPSFPLKTTKFNEIQGFHQISWNFCVQLTHRPTNWPTNRPAERFRRKERTFDAISWNPQQFEKSPKSRRFDQNLWKSRKLSLPESENLFHHIDFVPFERLWRRKLWKLIKM